MKITDDHWLDPVRRAVLPGGSEMRVRRCLIMHFTAGWSGASSVAYWRTPAAKGACAHLVIDRDGTIIQCRPFNRTCGHAGESKWTDPKTGRVYNGLNSCSIGIEMANAGSLPRAVYPQGMGPLTGQAIPRHRARHKNGGPARDWEIYPAAQLQAAEAVARLLVVRYNLDDIAGHDDIAPARKDDPGPAFPTDEFRRALGFG